MPAIRHLASVLAVSALALLAACDQPAPGTQSARAISAAAPAAPAGTRFDGRYSGTGTLTMSRGTVCGAQTQTRSVTVVNGNATLIIDPNRGSSATGPIQADGSVTMTSAQESTTVTGRFEGSSFNGELRGSACHRTLQLRRGAPA